MNSNKKFLQALGYAGSFQYDEDREERIQMHADKLYHQMIDYEKRLDEAKAAGQEPPPLQSLFNPGAETRQRKASDWPEPIELPGGEEIPAGFKPSRAWNQLTPHERELEVRSRHAQLEQQKLYTQEASSFLEFREKTKQKRQESRDKAVSWFGETVGKWISS